eukprot:Selendium_serpulae@DN1116_c0_g1_i1.p1
MDPVTGKLPPSEGASPETADDQKPSPSLSQKGEEEFHSQDEVEELMEALKFLAVKEEKKSTKGEHCWVFSEKEEKKILEEKRGNDSWQMKGFEFIVSRPVQSAIVALLLLDVVILMTEILIDAQYPPCFIIERDAISCCPTFPRMLDSHNNNLWESENNDWYARNRGAEKSADHLGAYSDDTVMGLGFLVSKQGRNLNDLSMGSHSTPDLYSSLECSDPSLHPVETNEPTCDAHQYPAVHTASIPTVVSLVVETPDPWISSAGDVRLTCLLGS